MKKILIGFTFISLNIFGMDINRSNHEASSSSLPPVRRSERLQIQEAMQLSMMEQLASSNNGKGKRGSLENNSQKSKRRKSNSNQEQQPNQIKSSDLIQELENIEKKDEDCLRRTDPEKLEKIKAFIRTRIREDKYSYDNIQAALIYYCLHPKVQIKKIADMFGFNYGTFRMFVSDARVSRKTVSKCSEKEIETMLEMRKNVGPKRTSQLLKRGLVTISVHAKKRGEPSLRNRVDDQKILDWYKSGGIFKDLYEIVTSSELNAKTKFAKTVRGQMNYDQKKQLIEENMDVIIDFREKLLTDEGRINKYKGRSIRIGDVCERNFGECEDFLIRNIAAQLGYDLSKLSLKWNIEYESVTQFSKGERHRIIDDFNEGFLTLAGLAKKYKTQRSVIRSIYGWAKNTRTEMKQKKATKNTYTSTGFSNISSTNEYLKYLGYQASSRDRLITSANQYNKTNPDQKKLFKEILKKNLADRRIPSNEYLNEIKPLNKGNSKVNEKFRKLLLILCNREDEIHVSHTYINRLKQELKMWIYLAEKESQ